MPPLSIMIKPASSLCNMRCEYCFYHDVSDIRDVKSFGVMSAETAENLIKKALSFADGESVAFAFQGGEPLIAGVDYFKNFISLVNKQRISSFENPSAKAVKASIPQSCAATPVIPVPQKPSKIISPGFV